MAQETYVGVKFKTILIGKTRHISKKDRLLIDWCNKFNRYGFTPDYGKGNSGNLSFRTKKGFVITPTASYYDKLSFIDLCEVIKADASKSIVYYKGLKKPSSESILHYLIYKNRKDVNAIFHGHFALFLDNSNKFITTKKELPYGSAELAKAAVETLGKNNEFIILKNHGFLSIGKNLDLAGNLALEKYRLILQKK